MFFRKKTKITKEQHNSLCKFEEKWNRQSKLVVPIVDSYINELANKDSVVSFIDTLRGGCIVVYYKTDADIKHYQENGTSDQIKAEIMDRLVSAGYSEDSYEKIEFRFDSDERVKRELAGNYANYWRS